MKIEIKLYKVFIAIIVLIGVIVGFIVVRDIKHRNERDRLSNSLYMLQDTVKTYHILVNGQREILAEQRTVIMSQKDAIANGILEVERLKAANIKQVNENTYLKAQIQVLKDSLALPDSSQVIYVTDSTGVDFPYLKLPTGMFYEDEWIGLGVTVFEDVTWSFNLKMGFDMNITTGYEKTGLFRKEPIATVAYANPYMDVVNIQSVRIEKSPMFYDRTWFHVATHGLAFLGGFYLGNK